MDKGKNQKKSISQKENSHEKNNFAMKIFVKIILRIVVFFCIAFALFLGGKYGMKKFFRYQIEKKHALVEKEISASAELVLYKMRYSEIVAIKKRKAISSAYSFVRFSGIIRAGIEDITQCQTSISEDGKSIRVKIPPATLLGNDIQSEEVFDERQGIFAKITTQEIFDEIAAAKEEVAREIIAEGLLRDADEHAALVIKQMLSPLGFKKIVIEE